MTKRPEDHECFHCAMHALYNEWAKKYGQDNGDGSFTVPSEGVMDKVCEFMADVVLDSQDTMKELAAAHGLLAELFSLNINTKMNVDPRLNDKWGKIFLKAQADGTIPAGVVGGVLVSDPEAKTKH
jgi:hypothetical protein